MVVLLGQEPHGVPAEAWDLIDDVVEIPVVRQGASLTTGSPDRGSAGAVSD